MALNGSILTNTAFLIGIIFFVGYPDELPGDHPNWDQCESVFIWSVVAHSCSLVIGFLRLFPACKLARTPWVIAIAQVFLFIYLTSVCFELHVNLMELGYSEGINFFDPNQVHKLEG